MYTLNTVGIDKIRLKDIEVKIVDADLFDSAQIGIKSTSRSFERYFYGTNIERTCNEILIQDKYFTFKAGIKSIKKGVQVSYERLEMNPSAIINGNNVNNISNPIEFKRAIEYVERRVLANYGLEINLLEASFAEIEVNNNIKLKESFTEYKNAFEFIVQALPKGYKQYASYHDREKDIYTGFKIQNREISLKFYDKLIERNIYEKFSILRVEYRFLKDKKIKAILGIKKVRDLLDDFSCVKKGFDYLIKKDIKTKIIALESKKIKAAYNLLETNRKKQLTYIKKTLAEMQDNSIFDYEILKKAIFQLNIDKSNKSRLVKKIKQILMSREVNGENKFFGNLSKVYEIVENL